MASLMLSCLGPDGIHGPACRVKSPHKPAKINLSLHGGRHGLKNS